MERLVLWILILPLAAKLRHPVFCARKNLKFRRCDADAISRILCSSVFCYTVQFKQDRYKASLTQFGIERNELYARGPYTSGFPCADMDEKDNFGKRQEFRTGWFKIQEYQPVSV